MGSRQVHVAEGPDNQEPDEASNQGLQEDDVRGVADGQSEACEDRCEGIPLCTLEEEHLMLLMVEAPCQVSREPFAEQARKHACVCVRGQPLYMFRAHFPPK